MSNPSRLCLETYTLGAFQVHNYLIWHPEHRQAVLIDSGRAPTAIINTLKENALSLAAIVYTHAHIDHVEGQPDILAVYPDTPIWMHEESLFWVSRLAQQANAYGLPIPEGVVIGQKLQPGQSLQFKGFSIEARYCPGHSPCGMTLFVPEAKWAFPGDVIFAGSVGRTDFPRGDWPTLKASIEREVWTLPPETVLYPGHGSPTTVAHEKATNRYLLA